MIYKFRIISEEVSSFKMEIEADADSTFLSLRNAILDAAGYTKDQLDSFAICDDEWRKEKEVTLADMDSDTDEDIWLMDETRLSDLIEDEGQKLAFIFDNLANRCFFMEMKEIIFSKDLDEPVCTRKVGRAPKQIEDFNFDPQPIKANTTAADLEDYDEDFYGSDSFNDDEFDQNGYDEFV